VTVVTSAAYTTVEAIDLSDMAFWAQPPERREQAFALLRAERPVAFFEARE